MSTIKSTIKLALIGEPQKTLVKAGILDGNLELTGEGKEAFDVWLWQEFGPKFSEATAPLFREDKGKK